jgi:SnoaL-like domain
VSENLELVRAIFQEWGHGDFRRADWFDPGIEFIRADGPAPGRWKGLDGMAEGYRDFLRNWTNYQMQAEECREVDGECILVLVHASGRGKSSGAALEGIWSQSAAVFQITGGLVSRMTHYFDRRRALADLGLEE